jgi:hypothetical protein
MAVMGTFTLGCGEGDKKPAPTTPPADTAPADVPAEEPAE